MRGLCVPCDTENALLVMSFWSRGVFIADIAGAAAGVAVGRIVAGGGQGALSGSHALDLLMAIRSCCGRRWSVGSASSGRLADWC